MNYEQKAKAYDEAVTKSIEFYTLCKKCGAKGTVDFLEDIFPELKESEDEKIRDEIKLILANSDFSKFALDYTFADMINWLEKQGSKRKQLINKACDILINCIEDFMLRRMEVWSEESKKQTLENIRKKLEE